MPSPFPGMDPYLEAHWGDVHASAIIYARDQLQRVLPKDLRARADERLVVAGLEDPRAIFPDVRVVERPRRAARARNGSIAVATAQPLVIELADEPETQAFLEIRERAPGSRLVTVVELLSPSNKAGGASEQQYLQKQHELLEAGVNLVEIDLLRAGRWVLALAQDRLEVDVLTPYRVVVRRGWCPTQAEYYAVLLRQRLPTISVPLRETDRDAPLDLQALFEQVYDNGAYDDIDYTKEPEPPLKGKDAAWADLLLRQAGLRKQRRSRKKI